MCPSSTSDTWKVSDLVLLSWIVQEPDIIQARLVLKSQKSKSLKKKPSCFQQEPPHVRVQRSRLTWTWTWSDLGKHLYTFLFTSVLVHTLVHLLVHILGVTGTRWSTVPLWLLIWLISLKWVVMHSLIFNWGSDCCCQPFLLYCVQKFNLVRYCLASWHKLCLQPWLTLEDGVRLGVKGIFYLLLKVRTRQRCGSSLASNWVDGFVQILALMEMEEYVGAWGAVSGWS